MVTQAQEQVKTHAEDSSQQINVQSNLLINYDTLLLQALSKALTELRADMVTQAQEQVKTHAEDSSQQINYDILLLQALTRVTDMVTQAQEQVKTHAEDSSQQVKL